ncbi:hypothetical protein ACKRZS_009089 [Fusarium odoratissimum]
MNSWLISHGRIQEATEILACIEDKPTTSPVVTAQLHEIQYSVDYELQHAVKWKDILLRRNKDTADTKTLRRLLLGANTQLMQQFGGINIMSYYMPTVLINSVGLSETNRKLEDMDDYFRENPSVMVIRDNDAIATKRPEKYIQREQEDIQREEAKDGSPVVGVGHEEKGLREQGNF